MKIYVVMHQQYDDEAGEPVAAFEDRNTADLDAARRRDVLFPSGARAYFDWNIFWVVETELELANVI